RREHRRGSHTQPRDAPHGDDRSGDATCHRDERALRQRLPGELTARGAERESYRQLAAPRARACEPPELGVYDRDVEHTGVAWQEEQQRSTLTGIDARVAERYCYGAPSWWRRTCDDLVGQRARERVELGVCPREGHIVFQASDQVDEQL